MKILRSNIKGGLKEIREARLIAGAEALSRRSSRSGRLHDFCRCGICPVVVLDLCRRGRAGRADQP